MTIRMKIESSLPKPNFKRAIAAGLAKLLLMIERDAKLNANAPAGSHPQVRTGRLRAGIYSKMVSALSGVVGDKVVYAPAIENGATFNKPEMFPIKAKALRFEIGGQVIFAKRVRAHSVTIPAYPFIEPAVQKNEQAGGGLILSEVKKEMKH